MFLPLHSLVLRLFIISAALAATTSFALAGAGAAVAPPGRFAFRTYTAEQGLGSLAITQLSQDVQGFLWVGTEDGLYRYDGSRFQSYSLKQGLPSSQITAIHQDPRGTFWVGTFGGLARWNGQSFDSVPGVHDVQGLATGLDGKLWVATPDGLFHLSEKSPRPEPLPAARVVVHQPSCEVGPDHRPAFCHGGH